MTQNLVTLPREQVVEILSEPAEKVRNLFIAGFVESDMLTLIRGDLSRLTVPLSIFRPAATATPDFLRFRLDDYGHSICFGEYEASADFILHKMGHSAGW